MDKDCKSFTLFLGGIHRKTTQRPYTYSLNEFMRFSKLDDYDVLASKDKNTLQDLLETWVISLKKRNLRVTAIRTKLSAVELFLDMNKKDWYRKIIRKLVGRDDEIPGGKSPFTTDEVFAMVKKAIKPRDIFTIHYLASTGTRPKSIEDPILRLKHVVDMSHDCKAIKIYEDSKEGYWTFLTPEASRAYNDYLKWRKINGEVITEDSPLFANYPNEHKTKKTNLSADSLRESLEKIMKSARIERVKTGNRYDKAIVYGFRKRFNGILKMNNDVNSNIAEKLMAHKRGLDGTYLQPTRDECFREFVKAIPELTVDPVERHNQELEQKDKEISQLQAKDDRIDKIEEELKKSQELIERNFDIMKLVSEGMITLRPGDDKSDMYVDNRKHNKFLKEQDEANDKEHEEYMKKKKVVSK